VDWRVPVVRLEMLVNLGLLGLQGCLVLKDPLGLSAIKDSPGHPVHPDPREAPVLPEMQDRSEIRGRRVLRVT